VAQSSKEKADECNSFFASVFITEDLSFLPKL